MTKNKQIAQFIFDKMKDFGYEPYDVNYGNGYFIFDMGDDSVVHFRVKGVWKHWKFGMWINSELLNSSKEDMKKYHIISIFAQYDTQIDKFKPTRSDLCVEFKASEWNENEKDNGLYLWGLENMLGMMRRHPFLCYDGFCGEYAGYRSSSFIWTFIRRESYEYKKKIKKAVNTAIFLPYTKAKIFFAKRHYTPKHIKTKAPQIFNKKTASYDAAIFYAFAFCLRQI